MRLEEIEKEYGDRVAVEWRSFLLRPFPEERDSEKFRAYTKSWERPASLEPAATFRPWASESAPPSHSLPAAVAGKVAAMFGDDAFRGFHLAAMRAYFAKNRTISEGEVLVEIAGETGLPMQEFAERLIGGWKELARLVFDEHNEAVTNGITAVPAVVGGLGGGAARRRPNARQARRGAPTESCGPPNRDHAYLIPGAVDTDVYRQVIARLEAGAPQ